jgi:hypothetical protein
MESVIKRHEKVGHGFSRDNKPTGVNVALATEVLRDRECR